MSSIYLPVIYVCEAQVLKRDRSLLFHKLNYFFTLCQLYFNLLWQLSTEINIHRYKLKRFNFQSSNLSENSIAFYVSFSGFQQIYPCRFDKSFRDGKQLLHTNYWYKSVFGTYWWWRSKSLLWIANNLFNITDLIFHFIFICRT